MGGLYSLCQQDHTSTLDTKSGEDGSNMDQNATAPSTNPPEIKTITERPSVAQKLISNGLITDVLNKAVAEPAIVKYGDKIIKLDNAILTPTETKDLPTVTWTGKSELYAVFLTDPDAISREEPLFREFVHFATLNVKATVINANSCGDVALEYAGPAPPYNSGLHRYVWLIYSQKEEMDAEPLTKYLDGRGAKKVNTWAKDNGLKLVAANLFEAEWDEHCDAAHTALDFVPPPKYQSPKQVEALKAAADLAEMEPEVHVQQEEELNSVAAKNLVNPDSIAATGEMLSDKLQKQSLDNKMNQEEQEELKDLAAKDLVNPDTIAATGEMLSEKLQKQSMDNKQEQEEQAELNELADKDLVNDQSKQQMENMLEQKMIQQAVDNEQEEEEREELKELADKDLVNEQSKAELEEKLKEIKEEEYKLGDEVFLVHLYADTDLNEQDGVVVELQNKKGKYLVQLHSNAERVRVMAKNMSHKKNKDGPKQKALQHMMVAGIGSFSEQQEMERRFTAPEAPPDPDATPAALLG